MDALLDVPVAATFYAKSAGVAWWTQGFLYVGVFFLLNYALALIALAALTGYALRRRRLSPRLALFGATLVFVVVMTIIGSLLVFDYIYIITQGGPAGASEVVGTLM